MRDEYDNCYHQAKSLQRYEYKNYKMISRSVQTNVLELLGVDDLLPSYQRNNRFTKTDLYNQQIDEESLNENEELDVDRLQQGIVKQMNKAIKKRMKLNPARMRSLPAFEIGDLIGNFDEDHNG